MKCRSSCAQNEEETLDIVMAESETNTAVRVVIESSIAPDQENKENLNEVSKASQSSIITRLHAGYFRISMSLGAQTALWKILSQPTIAPRPFLRILRVFPSTAFLLLWCLSVLALVSLSLLYILRCVYHFDMVKAEFRHHIGANFFYAPWISWLLLLQSAPLIPPNTVYHPILCWVFTIPVLVMDIKIYGQWFTTEKRFLSLVANPTSQISVVGNLMAALAAARIGWKESALFLFSLGLAHYLIIFVTHYQRLSGSDRFPAVLRPSFFLFFATPSLAGSAWSTISGSFDTFSKMLFFLSLFLFTSLVSRPGLFRKLMRRFNVAWWGYSFPLSFLAMASSAYAEEVKGTIAPFIMVILSTISTTVFIGMLLLSTLKTDRLFQ